MAKKKAPERFSISALLRDSIESRGLSSYAVGQMAGVNSTLVSRFLNGSRGLTLATADAIVDALGIRYAEVGQVKAKGKGQGQPSR